MWYSNFPFFFLIRQSCVQAVSLGGGWGQTFNRNLAPSFLQFPWLKSASNELRNKSGSSTSSKRRVKSITIALMILVSSIEFKRTTVSDGMAAGWAGLLENTPILGNRGMIIEICDGNLSLCYRIPLASRPEGLREAVNSKMGSVKEALNLLAVLLKELVIQMEKWNYESLFFIGKLERFCKPTPQMHPTSGVRSWLDIPTQNEQEKTGGTSMHAR